MERHAQRTFSRALAELSHVERLVVIHRNKFLLFIDGFNGGVRDSVGQPFVRHQCPAAEVYGRDIVVKLIDIGSAAGPCHYNPIARAF